jgi:hypothetical protein
MSRRRKTRRRLERQRRRHPVQRERSNPAARLGIGAMGIAGVAGGIALLVHASSVNESRIARIAGILIVLGLGAIAAAVFGWR